MVTISVAAAERLKEIAAGKEDPEKQMLRISFAGYG